MWEVGREILDKIRMETEVGTSVPKSVTTIPTGIQPNGPM